MVAFFMSRMDLVVTDTAIRVVRDLACGATFGPAFRAVFGSAFGAVFGSAFEAVLGAVFGPVFEAAFETPFGAAFVVLVLLATLRDETDFEITSFALVEGTSVFFGAARTRFAGAFNASVVVESFAAEAVDTPFARARVVTGIAVRGNQRLIGAKCWRIGRNPGSVTTVYVFWRKVIEIAES
jgi:hypothetical protein